MSSLILVTLVFSAGYFIGELRGIGLRSYIALNENFMVLKEIELGEINRSKALLNLQINSNVIELDGLRKNHLVPVEKEDIDKTFSRLLEFRKLHATEPNANSIDYEFHEMAKLILEESYKNMNEKQSNNRFKSDLEDATRPSAP